ncbi:MAG: hypothetical protein ACTSO9_06895 [Candidatus Helarchaeota archaeon]
MDCQKIIELYRNIFSRIRLLRPLKDDIIFVKVKNCLIKITRKNKQLSISRVNENERRGEMLIEFKDFDSIKQVLNADDLKDYGEKLLYAALDRKVILDPGNVEKATSSGFFKLLCRNRFKKHIRIFELIIPVI